MFLYKSEIIRFKKEIFLYAGGGTALRMIDSSQERRSRGFGENPEVTKAIIEFVRDNPGMSQDKISKEGKRKIIRRIVLP